MSEIEKQFFDTFGIKPVCVQIYDTFPCYIDKVYPQITDRILLELICISTSSEITVEFKGIKNVEHLKEVVLNYCIERYGYCLHKDRFKHQVQALFKENN